MGLIENTYKDFKTTLVGIILLCVPIAAWLFFEQPFELFSFVIMMIGIGFIFVPDTILDGFTSAKTKYLDTKDDKDGCSRGDYNKYNRYDKKR